ncbi:nucleotidyl transferase AbiEii/AbiGii toxin family protein [Paenibacillus oceani]|uniref:Nucleotidyl transferase AbiEii/AbiGii toxin family protein n=1 Tax=Paenibacillus oceani TaxID=2772510 RepID=A0A927CES4_9BACL|nr:nucleotidyl transferase AbiEii/AbiGii toxin family protein [Paenibacillus oceani]MBD2864641.1 nucleotidyl transferase AbiEii/AbiGii toxin family protein [Paenibacillus oceani]
MVLSSEETKRLRTITLIALFSDDDLLETLVLKGGNALEIGYGFNSRASMDLDFSMSQDFEDIGLTDLEQVKNRLEKVLSNTFIEYGYQVFEVRIKTKPKRLIPETQEFWAGYEVNFKIIEPEKFEANKDNLVWLSAKAIATSEMKKNITIDLGRFEYTGSKQFIDNIEGFEGYLIPIYTPTLIVLEKLRAICQQMEDYLVRIGKDPKFGKPRPRDFYDIYTILESPKVEVNFNDPETLVHLTECFKAKRVPINLLSRVWETRSFHKLDEPRLKETIQIEESYQGFDFYFDYVLELLKQNNLLSMEETA